MRVFSRVSRRLLILSAAGLLAVAGCSDDPATGNDDDQQADVGTGGNDAGVDDAGTADDTGGGEDVGGDEDTGGGQDVGPGEDTGGEDTGYDTGYDAGGSEEPPQLELPEAGLVITTDSLWVEHGAMGGSVEVGCEYRGSDGLPATSQPGDIEIEVSDYYEVDEDGRYSFAEAGVYEVSCSSESIEAETNSEIVVAYEGINGSFVEAVAIIGELDGLWRDFFAVIDEDEFDVEDVEEAFEAIEEAAAKLDEFSGDEPLLVDFWADWPELSDLEAEGFAAGSDDEDWVEVVGQLLAIQEDYRQVLAELSLDMTDEELDALVVVLAEIQQLHAQFAELEPSELAMYEHRDELAALIGESINTALFQVEVFAGLLAEEPIALPNASFVGQLGAAAVKIAWKRATGPLTGWYSNLLKDAGRAAAVSFMSMSFTQWWNSFMQPMPNAPDLTSIHGSAAGYICAGVAPIAYGSFQNSAEHFTLIILPPASLYPITHIADAAESMWGVRDNINDLINSGKKIEKLAMLANALEGVWSDLQDTQNPESGEFFTQMVPESGDSDFLHFGPLPTPLNDGSFPAGGSVWLYDAHSGFSQAVDVTVHPDSCG